ncbi:unnamed protein product [Mesocestoides corti]|uniref:Protein FRA10AC1 n=1 Tax=Mesocestoides corti TaxID=53468 RepID=A0A0R3UH61_MESCO|nr:unnamed protein product [Mesocestoides corti]
MVISLRKQLVLSYRVSHRGDFKDVEYAKQILAMIMFVYQRHKKMVNDYLQFYGVLFDTYSFLLDTFRDIDVIRANSRFVWEEGDNPVSWEERLAKRYWDRLFKEYCIADLSRYKHNKLGLRWRSEREVVSGKGQFVCGAVDCKEVNFLRSWEVNFAYTEKGDRRNALVKLRLCPSCSHKLNYHKQHAEFVASGKTADDRGTDDSELAPKRPREPTPEGVSESDAWKAVPSTEQQRQQSQPTTEDEFEDYLKNMFM